MSEYRSWGTAVDVAIQPCPNKPLLRALHERLNALAEIDAEILDAERELAQAEAAVTIGVLSATTGDGKALYSNDKARDAATRDAIWHDETCGELRAAVNFHRMAKAYAAADTEVLRAAVKLACITER